MTRGARIGVIGAGLIGRRHVALIDGSPDCVLAGLADPAPAAADVATALDAPFYADHRELLARERPDGVIIASPNSLHVDMALDCIAAGIPALVEKPVADTVAAARRLDTAIERSAVPILVGHHRRHNPIIRAAREAVAGGRLGRLTAVAGLFLLKKPDDYFEVAWRRQPGGGPLLINLIHDIDSLRFICGEIAEVQALASNGIRGFAVEDTAAVLLRFTNGALGTMTVSDATPAPWSWELTAGENPAYPRQDRTCYVLAGTEGSLSIPDLACWSYAQAPGWHAPLSRDDLAVDPVDPLVAQLRHFLDVIARRAPPLVSVADAMGTLAVIEAIGQAAARGCGVAPGQIMEKAA